MNVIGKKVLSEPHRKYSYHLSDGVYGSFHLATIGPEPLKFEVIIIIIKSCSFL